MRPEIAEARTRLAIAEDAIAMALLMAATAVNAADAAFLERTMKRLSETRKTLGGTPR